jgi:hypothetical protein
MPTLLPLLMLLPLLLAAAFRPSLPPPALSPCRARAGGGEDDDDTTTASSPFVAAGAGTPGGLPPNFNPFDYRRGPGYSKQPVASPSPFPSPPAAGQGFGSSRVSLRRMRMQELTSRLLRAAEESAARAGSSVAASLAAKEKEEGDAAMLAILEESRDFLLEPLEKGDGAVDDDPRSIYRGVATRSGRYGAYRDRMQERIRGARNPGARRVLRALLDFVLSHE